LGIQNSKFKIQNSDVMPAMPSFPAREAHAQRAPQKAKRFVFTVLLDNTNATTSENAG